VSTDVVEQVLADIPAERMPRHVGVIMDGNGRWASTRGEDRTVGHSRGADAVRRVVRASRRMGIEALTLFAFSSQNWDRPPAEVFHLMQLLRRYLFEERREILDNGIRLTTVGEVARLPLFVRLPLTELISASADNRGMNLCLALSYGGRETIIEATKQICREVSAGKLRLEDIDEDRFGGCLPSASLPPMDLLIRTSGERRVSNFFLWEIAYAELYFTETMWPDFGREDLTEAIVDYAARERRFGKTSVQVAEDADQREVVEECGEAPSLQKAESESESGSRTSHAHE